MNIPYRLNAVQLKEEFQTKLPQEQIQLAEQSASSKQLEEFIRQFPVVVCLSLGSVKSVVVTRS